MGLRKIPYLVDPAEQGLELIAFLADKLSLSRRRAKDLLDRRNVYINDRRVWMARHVLKARDAVTVFVEDENRETRPPAPPTILHEGAGYLVADKPPGLLSNGPDSAESLLRAITGNAGLRAVHRLDRDTSGCLLFAADDARFDRMVEQFRAGRIGKLYHALVAGRIEADTSIEKPLEGLKAVTRLHVLDGNRLATHVTAKIETGRTHQIRKHLSMIRHPVLGDREYGNSGPVEAVYQGIPRQMLHASSLEYPDPETDRTVRVEAPLPWDFKSAMKRMGLT
jgi:23S rRNA pseudouridine1911/1915/1917 synthase